MSKQWGHGFYEGLWQGKPKILRLILGFWRRHRTCRKGHEVGSGYYWCQKHIFHFWKCRDSIGREF